MTVEGRASRSVGTKESAPPPPRLILVESAAKAGAIRPAVRPGDEVVIAGGAWRELAAESGVAPQWVVPASRRRLLSELRLSASSSSEVLIATDPGVPGSVRAWHIAEALGPELRGKLRRVELRELTPSAVAASLARPDELPEGSFRGNDARTRAHLQLAAALRPVLGAARALPWASLLALRALCDREAEVEAFVAAPRVAVRVELAGPDGPFVARRLGSGGSPSLHTERAGEVLCRRLETARFEVTGVTRRRRRVRSPPPFTTITLLQAAFEELRFGVARTGAIAQRLYEGKPLDGQSPGVGLITHWHTDSTRVSAAAVEAARAWVAATHGPAALPTRPPTATGPPGEAIRPTGLDRDPNSVAGALARDEMALYQLVWARFVASQLGPAVYRDTRCELRAGRSRFGASWSELMDPGFRLAGQSSAAPPRLRAGERLERLRAEPEPVAPEAPRRFDDGSLVRELADRGWASPFEVAGLIEVLEECALIVRRGAELHPTRQGQRAVRQLEESLPRLLDPERLTAHERALAAFGGRGPTGGDPLAELSAALQGRGRRSRREAKRPRGLRCPDCGRGEVVDRPGRVGRTFFACSLYPKCRFRSPYRPVPGPCPDCGQPLLYERATKKGTVTSCRDPRCRPSKVSPPL
jgi:DNA topoisomerase I